MTPTGDYYRLLQVDPSADQEIVEAAYRRLARRHHPDLNPGDEAGARMRQLNEAYAVLKDPVRRAAYDRERDKAQRTEAAKATARAPRRPAPKRPEPRQPRRDQPPSASGPSPGLRPPSPIGRGLRRYAMRASQTLSRNRIVLTTAVGALIAAAVFAAFASRLFTPSEMQAAAATATPGVVVVNRSVPAEPTPTVYVRLTATAEPWPPFPLDRPVPVDEGAGGSADAAAVGSFLSRAGQDLQRRLLGGPRAPSTPVAPS